MWIRWEFTRTLFRIQIAHSRQWRRWINICPWAREWSFVELQGLYNENSQVSRNLPTLDLWSYVPAEINLQRRQQYKRIGYVTRKEKANNQTKHFLEGGGGGKFSNWNQYVPVCIDDTNWKLNSLQSIQPQTQIHHNTRHTIVSHPFKLPRTHNSFLF